MRVKSTKLGHIYTDKILKTFVLHRHRLYIDNPWIFQAPHFKDFYCSRNAGCKNALFEFTIQLFWGQRYFYLFSLWDRQHTTQWAKTRKKSPFWQDNALYFSKTNVNIFFNFSEWRVPKGQTSGVKKIFSKNVDFTLCGNRATT